MLIEEDCSQGQGRRVYAIVLAGTVVGMTAWIEHGAPGWFADLASAGFAQRGAADA